MIDKLQCFTCRKYKLLEAYEDNRRHYQIKWYKGKCFVCRSCEKTKLLNTLSAVRYNFETKNFEIIKFKNKNQAIKHLKK